MRIILLDKLLSYVTNSKYGFICYNLIHNGLNFKSFPLLIAAGRNKSRLKQCSFVGLDNGVILIGERCSLSGVRFFMGGEGNRIMIGDCVTVNACKNQPTYFNACEGASIQIGENSLFSNNVEIHTTDYHSVLREGIRSNLPADVVIGEHCWIGLRSIIMKGTILSNDSVVGCCSVVTKSFSESNVIIAGNPASVVKQAVSWR